MQIPSFFLFFWRRRNRHWSNAGLPISRGRRRGESTDWSEMPLIGVLIKVLALIPARLDPGVFLFFFFSLKQEVVQGLKGCALSSSMALETAAVLCLSCSSISLYSSSFYCFSFCMNLPRYFSMANILLKKAATCYYYCFYFQSLFPLAHGEGRLF